MKEENLIREKSYNFALEAIKLYKFLTAKSEYVISKQILRSGTSIGANIEEAVKGINGVEVVGSEKWAMVGEIWWFGKKVIIWC